VTRVRGRNLERLCWKPGCTPRRAFFHGVVAMFERSVVSRLLDFLFFSVPSTCSYLFPRLFARCYFSADGPFLRGFLQILHFFRPPLQGFTGGSTWTARLVGVPFGDRPGQYAGMRTTVSSHQRVPQTLASFGIGGTSPVVLWLASAVGSLSCAKSRNGGSCV
jgi:hypothetical protein